MERDFKGMQLTVVGFKVNPDVRIRMYVDETWKLFRYEVSKSSISQHVDRNLFGKL